MKIAIMQPYFLPYIGYWQLLNAVDEFVVYDNIEYSKKGWINRNRFLLNDYDAYFTLPLKKDSDFLTVKERSLALDFNRMKLFAQLSSAYKKSPYFSEVMPIIEKIIKFEENNLFLYIHNSLSFICKYLNIQTKITISSNLNINHNLKGQDKVIEICKKLNAKTYINAIGGQELYSKQEFEKEGIELKFIQTKEIVYKQFNNVFIPNLSILDVLMFNEKGEVKDFLYQYNLL